MQHKDAAPLSVLVLYAAEKWGCPPWEIAGGKPVKWLFRWLEFENQRAKAEKK